MDSLLSQLPDETSLLMMLAAGELPTGDREAVEARLQNDAALRGRFQEIQQLMGEVDSELDTIESSTPVQADAAIRRATQAIRGWHARPAAIAPLQLSAPRPWRLWMAPAAAAAVAAVVIGVWLSQNGNQKQLAGSYPFMFSNHPQSQPSTPEIAGPSTPPTQADDVSGLLTFNPEADPAAAPNDAASLDLQQARHDPDPLVMEDGGGYKAVFDIPLDAAN